MADIEKLVNTDCISNMVFKRSQKSQLKKVVSGFLLFGKHNRSMGVLIRWNGTVEWNTGME